MAYYRQSTIDSDSLIEKHSDPLSRCRNTSRATHHGFELSFKQVCVRSRRFPTNSHRFELWHNMQGSNDAQPEHCPWFRWELFVGRQALEGVEVALGERLHSPDVAAFDGDAHHGPESEMSPAQILEHVLDDPFAIGEAHLHALPRPQTSAGGDPRRCRFAVGMGSPSLLCVRANSCCGLSDLTWFTGSQKGLWRCLCRLLDTDLKNARSCAVASVPLSLGSLGMRPSWVDSLSVKQSHPIVAERILVALHKAHSRHDPQRLQDINCQEWKGWKCRRGKRCRTVSALTNLKTRRATWMAARSSITS